MKKKASREVADFLRFCRFERRLAPLTCSAYERDVFACLAYLEAEGIELAEVQVTHLPSWRANTSGGRPSRARRGRPRR
jgi:site-specific recombinase XerD